MTPVEYCPLDLREESDLSRMVYVFCKHCVEMVKVETQIIDGSINPEEISKEPGNCDNELGTLLSLGAFSEMKLLAKKHDKTYDEKHEITLVAIYPNKETALD